MVWDILRDRSPVDRRIREGIHDILIRFDELERCDIIVVRGESIHDTPITKRKVHITTISH
jgi:hypothetical protein